MSYYQCLQHHGCVHKKCLTDMLHYNDDDNDDDCLSIMTNSSYYENDHYMSLINAKTNSFGILSIH